MNSVEKMNDNENDNQNDIAELWRIRSNGDSPVKKNCTQALRHSSYQLHTLCTESTAATRHAARLRHSGSQVIARRL